MNHAVNYGEVGSNLALQDTNLFNNKRASVVRVLSSQRVPQGDADVVITHASGLRSSVWGEAVPD
jgi:hypothetical protein